MNRAKQIVHQFKLAGSLFTGRPVRSFTISPATIELRWESAAEDRRAMHDPDTLKDEIARGKANGMDMSFEEEALQAYNDWDNAARIRHAQWREDRANKHANRIKSVARNRRSKGAQHGI